jgi:hemerythrin superfamily protein
MDAIEFIKQDHRKIAELFEQFLQAESDMTQEELLQAIQNGLSTHSEMEERVLYPELKSIAAVQVERALQEHLEIRKMPAELLDEDLDEDSFVRQFRELKDDFQTHVEEEEAPEGILELARQHFGARKLSQMGSRMQDIQRREREDLAA